MKTAAKTQTVSDGTVAKAMEVEKETVMGDSRNFLQKTASNIKTKIREKKIRTGLSLLEHDKELHAKNARIIEYSGVFGLNPEKLHKVNDALSGYNPIANWMAETGAGKSTQAMLKESEVDWSSVSNMIQNDGRDEEYHRVKSGSGKYQKVLGPSESVVPYAAYPPMYGYDNIPLVD
ncbi:MAG: hypothetical protein QKV58_gp2 [Avonheates virus SG_924]|uniref:hypothetical protein n=1 Tax=Avonheates virus SG_924 TaxID=2914488 RepID=UPI002481D78D|nr:MAG: hypothetical protein QKV58_gp2 [Avonheates virus SG_924]UNI72607.1 MAG: hypothetical protein [Avonheates virus SG_924]